MVNGAAVPREYIKSSSGVFGTYLEERCDGSTHSSGQVQIDVASRRINLEHPRHDGDVVRQHDAIRGGNQARGVDNLRAGAGSQGRRESKQRDAGHGGS